MALRDPAAGGSKSEIKTAAKHVVIFDRRPSDGGSIPPASTIRLAKSARSWQAIKVAESFLTESNGAPSLSRGAKCIRNADEETVATSTYRKFLKIIDRSKARVKKEGSISASELRRPPV